MSSIKSHKKKLNKKWMKSKALLVSMLLLLVLTVGGTIAFLVDKEDAITNTFTPSEVKITVEEFLEEDTKSNVKIKNTGNTEAYIRAAVVITWQDENGNVFGTAPTADDYTIIWGTDEWDRNTADGLYYYTLPVKAGESTKNLIAEVKSIEGKAPEGYSLNVEILASAIQSLPTSVVIDEWGVTLAKDGVTISKN